MRLFYYAHTGHRIGLDRFRRAAAIINALDMDMTLLTSDYRIASVARDFGIKRAVGIDVVRNIPQIAQHGDKIIFDSAEHNPALLDEMTAFFSTFIRISDDPNDTRHPNEFLISPYLEGTGTCKGVVVDESYFQNGEKTIEKSFFFGDDDYEKDIEAHLEMLQEHQMDLGVGFYYFYDYEAAIAKAFTACHEFENYEQMIKASKMLLSASPQAVLETLASQGRPIYLQRRDYPRDFLPLFKALNVPIIDGFNAEKLAKTIGAVASHSYHILPNETAKVVRFIKESLAL